MTNDYLFRALLQQNNRVLKALICALLHLEMQVVNEHNWEERSLCYLCRSFDNLNRGVDYSEIKPAVQIGILNFSLFPQAPEFYANYYMMNEKTYHKYSDKFRLAVVDLTQIERATKFEFRELECIGGIMICY